MNSVRTVKTVRTCRWARCLLDYDVALSLWQPGVECYSLNMNLLGCFITAMEALTKTVGKEVNKLVPAETKGLFDEVKSFSSRVTVPLAVT